MKQILILRHPFPLSFEEHGLKRFLFLLLDAVDYAIFVRFSRIIHSIIGYSIVGVMFSCRDLKDKRSSLDFELMIKFKYKSKVPEMILILIKRT